MPKSERYANSERHVLASTSARSSATRNSVMPVATVESSGSRRVPSPRQPLATTELRSESLRWRHYRRLTARLAFMSTTLAGETSKKPADGGSRGGRGSAGLCGALFWVSESRMADLRIELVSQAVLNQRPEGVQRRGEMEGDAIAQARRLRGLLGARRWRGAFRHHRTGTCCGYLNWLEKRQSGAVAVSGAALVDSPGQYRAPPTAC